MNNKAFKRTKHKLAQAVALGVLALAINQAHATNYTFSDLGTMTGPYAGANSYLATGINNLGQVVGFNNTNALVWNGNTATPLDNLPVGTFPNAWAINDAGQVAGWNSLYPVDGLIPVRWDGTVPTALYTSENNGGTLGINSLGQTVGADWVDGGYHAARWDGTAVTMLGTLPGGAVSQAQSINDAGQIVGVSFTADMVALRPVLFDNNTITDLGTLGGLNGFAFGINNAGQIVGNSMLAGDETTHATLWNINGDTPFDLGSLSGDSTAQAINDAGVFVGYSTMADGNLHATLWDGAGIIDLNNYLPADLAAAGWFLTQGRGINASGAIVGMAQQGLDPATAVYGSFELTPSAVPVPGAVWLFGSALAGFVGMSRRKQTLAV